ncbi:MAG: SDR family NAD(P)-dependent oxidoreductase [Hyphomicrobium sp.]
MPIRHATRVADLWLTRGRALPAEAVAARDAVAQLSPAVVVTGGSRGIGAAIAERFALSGVAVALVARNAENLEQAAHQIASRTGARVIAIVCDVTKPDAHSTLSTQLSRESLYLDVLVNSAGLGLSGPFASHEQKDIDALLALNIDAVTRLTRAALPAMLARRRGGILNVASLGAYAPGPHQAAYYASKAYVTSLTEAIAVENAGSGVRVSVLAPGPVDTPFHADMGADRALYRQIVPAVSPERAARAAHRGFMLGQRVIVPGLINRALLGALKLLPHPLTVPIVARLLQRPPD